MANTRTTRAAVSFAAIVCIALTFVPSARAQAWCGGLLQPPCPTTTTAPTTTAPTTTAPPATTTTKPPATTTPGDGSTTTAPPATTTPGDGDDGDSSTTTTSPTTTAPGDGSTTTLPDIPAGEENPDGTGDSEGQGVPADAQQVINSVNRSGPNSSSDLLAAIQPLIDMGLSAEEAIRISFGAFPIAGDSHFTHDWLFPRYGPGFRHHKGTDIFAAYGTPVRAVTDGTLRASDNGLGGLVVRVVQPDGLYFYYAHLSALPDDYVEGASVKTGDIVGYVGDSGNAKGGTPHLHFGIYRGGVAIDPKPFLDQALEEAMDNLPSVIEQVRQALAAGDRSAVGARRPRSLLATSLLRERASLTAAGVVTTETLYQTTGNPSVGAVAVVETEAGRLAAVIDWTTRLIEPVTEEVSELSSG